MTVLRMNRLHQSQLDVLGIFLLFASDSEGLLNLLGPFLEDVPTGFNRDDVALQWQVLVNAH